MERVRPRDGASVQLDVDEPSTSSGKPFSAESAQAEGGGEGRHRQVRQERFHVETEPERWARFLCQFPGEKRVLESVETFQETFAAKKVGGQGNEVSPVCLIDFSQQPVGQVGEEWRRLHVKIKLYLSTAAGTLNKGYFCLQPELLKNIVVGNFVQGHSAEGVRSGGPVPDVVGEVGGVGTSLAFFGEKEGAGPSQRMSQGEERDRQTERVRSQFEDLQIQVPVLC